MNYEEIRNAFKTLDTEISYNKSLLRADLNADTTYVMIDKHKGDVRNNKKRLQVLINALTNEKKILEKDLQQIARTYNDTESEIFVKYVIQGKAVKDVITETGLSEGYVRHCISNIKRGFDYNEH